MKFTDTPHTPGHSARDREQVIRSQALQWKTQSWPQVLHSSSLLGVVNCEVYLQPRCRVHYSYNWQVTTPPPAGTVEGGGTGTTVPRGSGIGEHCTGPQSTVHSAMCPTSRIRARNWQIQQIWVLAFLSVSSGNSLEYEKALVLKTV